MPSRDEQKMKKKMDEWLKGSRLSPQRHFMNAREEELTAGALRAVCVCLCGGGSCVMLIYSVSIMRHFLFVVCCNHLSCCRLRER